MNRKDYLKLANALHGALVEARATGEHFAIAGVYESINRISTALSEDNERFDPWRFTAACQSGQGL